ncbi:PTS fructose transporter subunit IIA [Abyssibius alkaniclasticus]|uniref:PTS sugar transporter subunit IIA n=1 Tax=Abyssibius alkaniclasticus TaxID=2881234 RepID=UPI002363370F|nr:PTS fructose transporter subunit IIA [Abyssibius alkaniclasticus]UPH71320.1 PTS fructose transporter subunit IIA [Abyssibius alkaniclasticus]|tara:strand:- start:1615 stop:2058 length:444 start_codon:yes stop_codon:yes gene_type:complete
MTIATTAQIGIVIVAHGGLAVEYRAAMEHVVGPQNGVATVAIGPHDARADKQDEICAAIATVDAGVGVVIVTDMFGGTPSNLALAACESDARRVIYGANLPLLVKLAKARRKPLAVAVDFALTAGRKYIDCCTPATNAPALKAVAGK